MVRSQGSLRTDIEPIPENLFRAPIDYLYAEHFRQQIVCNLLDEIALGPARREAQGQAARVLSYLEHDLPHHIADEEKDLLPFLRERCRPADRAERVLRLLSEEHSRDQDLSDDLCAGLRALAAGNAPAREDAFLRAATAFAELQRRHLAWEDELILPLARKRLTAEDLKTIGQRMAERRGVDYPD